MIPDHQQIVQFSWVVPDLETAARRWHETTGIGPFLVNRHLAIGDPLYRGTPQSTDFSTAIAQAGPVQIELVEQHDDTPSCYRDTVPPGAEAMHHVAIVAADYDAALTHYTAQGFAVASQGRFGDVRFAYVDCSPAIGHMVEILEDKPTIRRFFAAIVRAAERWDRDPRTLIQTLG
jgi:catechol 2,3-dioxygenase-like lactoylglutathione lyase family enzyme